MAVLLCYSCNTDLQFMIRCCLGGTGVQWFVFV